jgi:uncharacterized membrane protein YfcA
MHAWQWPLLFAAGLGAGFVDAIAGGGGLITVPVLILAGLPQHLALGTNKFQSSCGTALATWHYARAKFFAGLDLRLGIFATLGAAAIGALTVNRLSPDFLRVVIPILLIAIALYTWLRPRLGAEEHPPRLPWRVFALLFGVVLGFYDGFFGPGTGSFWTMGCVLVMGMELRRATAYTKAMNLMSNLASLAVFLLEGQVDFRVGLIMAAGQLIGARLGSGLVIRQGAQWIRPILILVVLTLAAKLIRDNLLHWSH